MWPSAHHCYGYQKPDALGRIWETMTANIICSLFIEILLYSYTNFHLSLIDTCFLKKSRTIIGHEKTYHLLKLVGEWNIFLRLEPIFEYSYYLLKLESVNWQSTSSMCCSNIYKKNIYILFNVFYLVEDLKYVNYFQCLHLKCFNIYVMCTSQFFVAMTNYL